MNPPNFEHTLKQISATRCNSKKSVFLPQCIYNLHMICRINTNYFPKCYLQAIDFLINSPIPMRNLHIKLYMRRKTAYRRLRRNIFGRDFRRTSGLRYFFPFSCCSQLSHCLYMVATDRTKKITQDVRDKSVQLRHSWYGN